MYDGISTLQAFLLTITILMMIFLVHKSKLRLLQVQVKAETSRAQLKQAVDNMCIPLDGLRAVNNYMDKIKIEQKASRIMCFMDDTKECDICHGDCPYRKGGEVK